METLSKDSKHSARVQRLLDQARIPFRYQHLRLSDFLSRPDKAAAAEKARYALFGPGDGVPEEEWEKWNPREGVFLWGQQGVGKTALASVLLAEYIRFSEESGLFIVVPQLLEDLRRDYELPPEERDQRLFDVVKTIPVLVLDDVGAEKPTPWVQERLFLIVNHRYNEKLITIVTANMPLDELALQIGERTVWRIAEMTEVVHLEGANLRAKRPA